MTMRLVLRLAGPLLALAVAGCSLVPDFVRPSVPAPDKWKDAAATAQAASWPGQMGSSTSGGLAPKRTSCTAAMRKLPLAGARSDRLA